jgi:hypothetical protein
MTDTDTRGPYRTLADIRAANAVAGHYFFTPDTLRFFRSRIAPGVIGGRFFVTSEQFVPSSGDPDPRLYTVRRANDDGTVDTVGDFQAYLSLASARAAARRMADGA